MSQQRPTIKDVYDVVDRLEQKVEQNFATKVEMRLTVALAVVGGSATSSLVASLLTHQTTAQQFHALARVLLSI